jgi:predicted phage terminase large subunit-like protein
LGIYDSHYYLLHVLRQRLNYPDLKRKVIEQIAAYNPRHVIIEGKASGTQLIQDLKSEGVYLVKPYQAPPQTNKIMRLHTQTGIFERGRVLLPNAAPWLAEYKRELTTFLGTKFDDQADSTTQALDYLSTICRSLDIWARLAH